MAKRKATTTHRASDKPTAAHGNKKVKTNSEVASREILPRPSVSSDVAGSDDDQDDDEDENDDQDIDSEDYDEQDDEVNEFELEQQLANRRRATQPDEEDEEDEEDDEDNDDDDMMNDDAQDLYADLDKAPLDDDSEDDPDDDEDDGDEDGEGWSTVPTSLATTSAPATTRKARNSKGPKALTASELRALAFAELTASPISNLISTQVSSVLATLTPPAAPTSPLQPLLKSLHSHFVALTSKKPASLESLKRRGWNIPPVEGVDGKWGKIDLAWAPPRAEDVRIVGSWAWGGASKVGGEYVVELAVGIPEVSNNSPFASSAELTTGCLSQTLMEPRDYLSPRFVVKSSHYLVVLASSLPESLGPISCSYVPLGGAQGYALELRSAHVKGTERRGLSTVRGAVLRIRIVWPGEAIAHSKLSPTSNVVRPATADAPESSSSTIIFPATPLHTTALHLSSLSVLTAHLKYHHALASSHSSYPSAVRLLQAWAQKRSYGTSLGFASEFWAWCVARTLGWGSTRRATDPSTLSTGGDAWAMWRKVMEWLAGINWIDGIWFRAEGDASYDKEQWRNAFKGRALFIDPTGTVNLAAGIELSMLEMANAKTTISLLLAPGEDEKKFDAAFVRPIRPVARFDNLARIVVPSSRLAKPDDADALDHVDGLSYLVTSISATLSRALGNRAKAFQLMRTAPSTIPVKGGTSSPKTVSLDLGILLDATESGRLVDQGPSAEDEAGCAEFAAFWGPKAELRRFKDGAIVESVVWDEPSKQGLGSQRNKVVSRIIEYIVRHRHGLEAKVFAGPMDHLLVEPEALRRALYLEDAVATGKGFSSLIGAFDDLSKELKELPELPLGIASVQPSSPGLRYSSVFVPSSRRLKDFEQTPASTRYIELHDIHLTLESSGRWPDDLEGIQKIKAAFLTKIGEQLEQTRAVLTTNVVFDTGARPMDDNVSLEILTAAGYAFRARIHYDRSLLLLKERQAKMGDLSIKEPLLLAYEDRFVHSPRHHAAISTLQHHFPSYSPTVRLVKRWCSAHLLSHYIAPELLELLSASVFIDAASPFEAPQSSSAGFARVMTLLSEWKWKDEPLCVPLYTFQLATTSQRRPYFPPAEAVKVKALFEANRVIDLGRDEHAWVIATEEDLTGKVWGQGMGKLVAARVKGLAKATLQTMHEGVLNDVLIVETLFLPPLQDYDFLLHIDSSVNPRHFQSIAPEAKALSWSKAKGSILAGSVMSHVNDEDEDDSTIRLGFDPVTDFVRELEFDFPGIFKLFHSPSESAIGGIWNPSIVAPKTFKVGLGVPLKPLVIKDGSDTSKPKVELDKANMLRQIERLGRGLLTKVEMVKA
ncbi:BZ3500_MvSof-1268-A1-R1_Chr3-1g05495 [Microbotryum saponariae]|uniref:BZ3500_MvSof-1268-A1-R1_Chr3-1g05495 protein n=1 Tax=Microbotryum saponariae TaxID=289078 RepID=A0A2X0NGN4_9BASI|nr:BZ3500_MvSof-1268-A1-R1_Chr3-1g05495 [Microbotryum saponariae]SDA04686.1 BZ3501_MvSof-1269-A2-R1_Chr3-1g05166 [Microbotryum saponariae]